MKLRNMFKRYLKCDDEERRFVVASYRKERFNAIANHSSTMRMGARVTYQSLGLSADEIVMVKKLGLKPKDIKALRG